jgi:hypothetical protein
MKSKYLRIPLAILVALLFTTAAIAGQIVTGNVTFTASFTEASPTGALTSFSIPANINSGFTYANGTASGQVDTIYAAKLTLSGATQTIDLTNLTDPANNAITFARVREFIVQNTASTASYDVKVEAGGTNGWAVLPPSTAPVYCRYGSSIKISDSNSTGSGNGNVVTSTSKTITFDPGANTVTIYLLIVGGSAA